MSKVVDMKGVALKQAPVADPGVRRRPPKLAVIVPTLNERENIVPLVRALDAALAGHEAEIIFVDDWSSDGTAGAVERIARQRTDVRLIRRHGRRGLASAAIEGMFATTADIVAVIDADLQHDERILPEMVRAIESGQADVAIGSRYHASGSCAGLSEDRARISRAATRLAHAALSLDVADPLSGFFAVRRETVVELAPRLSGKGFKILLDILTAAPQPLRTREIPYSFRSRHAGASKLGAGVAFDYLGMIVAKLAGRLLATRLAMFGLVGLLGVGVNLALLRAGLALLAFPTAQALAVTATIAFNFMLNNSLTYRDRKLHGVALLGGLASFYLVCGLGALANVGIGTTLYMARHNWWLAGLAGTIVGAGWNFLASASLTWRAPVAARRALSR